MNGPCPSKCETTPKFFKWAVASSNNTWDWENTDDEMMDDAWNHLAFSFNKGVIESYINGILIDKRTRTVTEVKDAQPTFNDLRIGGRQGGSQFFRGSLDDFRFYSRAISSEEVQLLYSDK